MRRNIQRGVILALLAMLAQPLGAQTTRAELLVSTQWLQSHRNTVTIVYAGDHAGYDTKHIAGALFVEASSLAVRLNGIPSELPPVNTLEKVFQSAGVSAHGPIVVYSTDPLVAARAWFTLDYLGQGDRIALLDGGLTKWLADGYATTAESTVATPGSFEASPRPGW